MERQIVTRTRYGGMEYIDVRERPAGPGRAAGPGFEPIASKLRRPLTRPGTIIRSSLVGRLTRDDLRPIVSLVAPSGYGKTTLLSQWAERSGQAVAWVSIDEHDNDPKVLLSYVAEALDRVQPIGERVFEALASPVSSVPGSVVPRLGAAFWSMTVPLVLVLDDVHLLRKTECRDALSVLADHVPSGSRLVLAGRNEPPLRIARLRAEGRITEIGPGDLSLTREEAGSLLRAADVRLGEDDLTALHRRTEGWPAGLYLAALYLREGGSPETAAVSFGGDDRLVSEYLEAEFLARISRRQRAFLTQTAVLERMCGPLCDALLDQGGSADLLASLARSNLLLVPLDRRGQWYRYHHLFRDMLLAELERTEPGLMPPLRRRAAAWCQRASLLEEALEYSVAAGDVDAVAELVERLWLPALWQGRVTTLQRWLGWLDEHGGIEGHPMVAMAASVLAASTGRPVEAERWADVADRLLREHAGGRQDHTVSAWGVLLRAVLCRSGAVQMLADADEAARSFAARGAVLPVIPFLQGLARVLAGDPDKGDSYFEDAVSIGEKGGMREVRAIARCERALVAMHAANGTGPRPSPGRPARRCVLPEWRKASPRRWSARCEPGPRCTGATSRQRGRNLSARNGCGRC